MNKLMRLLCGLAAVALLAGCAGGVGGGVRIATPALMCPAPACDAYVSVWTDGAGICRLAVSDEEIEVPPGNSPNLIWQLRPLNPGDGFQYQFDTVNGIAFKPTPAVTPADFDSNDVLGPRNSKYKWRSVNRRPFTAHYNVNVQRRVPSGTWASCPVLDPRIVNDGP